MSFFVALIWLVHGLYNKLLHGSPRHLQIVQSVPGLAGAAGERVLLLVGIVEVAIAVWILSGRRPRACASAQTVLLLSMNAVELTFARPLLLWPAGLVPINLAFLGAAWAVALSPRPAGPLTRLRRHPLAIRARLRDCLTLTYALPPHVLRPLLPPGLELEVHNGYGFIAVALVQTESLRPAGLPAAAGQDFFLAGYRIFTTFAQPGSTKMRGLRILRSDADSGRMVVGGNLLTHYNYHRCAARLDASSHRIEIMVRTQDGAGDIELTGHLNAAALPAGSPFASVREARRFAGPLPYTFDYERETHAIIAINARRTNWQPAPVTVDVRRLSFFDRPAFAGCTPVLAAAFHVHDVDYRWQRGVVFPLTQLTERVEGARSSMRGVKQIVCFNWTFYAGAASAIVAAALAMTGLPLDPRIRALLLAVTGLAAFWIVASIAVSWVVYDRSRLTEWTWVRDALGSRPRRWVNIHAGLDESTPVLRRLLDPSDGRVFDIFDPVRMTEPSIARARRLRTPAGASEAVDSRRLPAPSESIDAAFLLLSAHELRTDGARGALFGELRRVLSRGGRVIVAEHLRSAANLAAFGPGFLHFFSRRTWQRCFCEAGFVIHREFSITPFVRVFVLGRSQ